MRGLLDHFVLSAAVLLFCGPVLWLVVSAVGPSVLTSNWNALTETLSPDGPGPSLSRVVYVSTVLALAVALLSTTLSFLAAYAFVFLQSTLVSFAFWCVVATLYFPVEARMLRTFDVAARLGLTSSFAGLAFPVLQLGLGTLYFRQHFKKVPIEILQAARLDGANTLKCLLDIVLPFSRAQVATVGLVTFIWGWNQYLWPLMISVDDRHWTIVRALERVGVASGAGLLLATMALLPPLILVLILLRTSNSGLRI